MLSNQSCISEAQKYQGALYKEKPGKAKKAVTISESTPRPARRAYVEDAPDQDLENSIVLVEAPPAAPTPPSALLANPVNVFDFLVTENNPNASWVSLGGSNEQMRMVDHAPSVFEPGRQLLEPATTDDQMHDDYDHDGFSYGAAPVPAANPTSYQTPAPKLRLQNGSHNPVYELSADSTSRSTDKKRKRQVEELDLTQARRPSQDLDEDMPDASSAEPPILHSGLTGGLNRLLSKPHFPPSPSYSGGDANPPIIHTITPVKRTRSVSAKEKEKSRGRATSSSALVRVRKIRRTSDESRPRKHHRSHGHGQDDHVSENPKKLLKSIEYPSQSTNGQEDSQNQLVVYRARAELFMSFITKGPESESGCSLNKALKRYHRERGERGLGLGKADEEKELWKSLRLRRNDRGEIVLMC